MKILRAITAILVGYILFALGSMVVLSLGGAVEGPAFVALSIVALAGIGLASGLATAGIAGEKKHVSGVIVATLVTLATLANLLMKLGAEPTWYKVTTLLLTVPAVLWATHRSA